MESVQYGASNFNIFDACVYLPYIYSYGARDEKGTQHFTTFSCFLMVIAITALAIRGRSLHRDFTALE